MSKIKLFLVACLLGMAATASAQFANSKGSSSNSEASTWQGLRFSYHPMSFKYDGGGDSEGLTGLSFGYTKGIALSSNVPLFLEVGANILWTHKKMDYDYDNYAYDGEDYDSAESDVLNMFSVNIPVNFGYKFVINDQFSLYPYVGVNFRVNAFGTYKNEGESYNIFDKKEMGEAFNRFQAGWQIGVAFNFNKFMLAGSYGQDFTEISKKVKLSMPSITLGYNF